MSWVDDTQGAVKEGSSPSECVVEGKPKPGTPVAARFSVPVTPENNYFEVTVVNSTQDSSAFVGITSEGGFKPGYGLKACLFGGPGNLSSGLALVKDGFGRDVKTGTVVGVLVEYVGDEKGMAVKASFFQDGKALGLGFLADLKDPAAQVYPVIQASKDGDRFSCKFAPAPEGSGDAGGAPVGGHPAEGVWTVNALRLGADLAASNFAEKMEGMPLTFVVAPGEGAGLFEIMVSCVNQCMMDVQETEGGKLAQVGPGPVGGRMAGPEGQMALEAALCENLPSLSEWTPAAGSLLLKGATIEVELVGEKKSGGGGGKKAPSEHEITLP